MRAIALGGASRLRVGTGLAWLLAAMGLAPPAWAQFPDVLSDAECPGCRALFAATPLEGTWSTALTAANDPGWALEDFLCVTACTAEARARAAAALTDPRDAQRSAVEIAPRLDAVNVRALRLGCDALGFADQVVSPLPLSIRRESDRLVLRYEERGATRSIALDAHAASAAAGADAPLGASTGRFQDGALVVETRAATLHATERYSVSADGRWLTLELRVERVGGLEPLVATKRWLRTPAARLASHGCDAMSAGLTATLWDYLDPRIVDARRARIATQVTRRGE